MYIYKYITLFKKTQFLRFPTLKLGYKWLMVK